MDSQGVVHREAICALGVILYEMLAGSTPFPGDNPLVVMNLRLLEPPIAPRDANPKLKLLKQSRQTATPQLANSPGISGIRNRSAPKTRRARRYLAGCCAGAGAAVGGEIESGTTAARMACEVNPRSTSLSIPNVPPFCT
jgi:serine/threonine protein kinase